MILIYIGTLFLLLYYLFKKTYSYWESKNVPYEKPFLFFGSLYNIVTRKESMFERIRSIYEKFDTPYVGIYMLNRPFLVVRSPELLRKILVKDFDKFVNRGGSADESIDPIAFHALFSSKDTTWKNVRVKMSPVFTSGKIKMMFPLMKECAQDLNDYLAKRSGETLELYSVAKKYSVDVISSCAFGINSYCLKNENSEILKMATKLLDADSFVRSVSILSFFFVPALVKIFRLTFADKTAMTYLLNIFKDTIKERTNKKIVRNDLIDLLNNLRNNETVDEKYKFNDLTMAAQAISFFSAGNDTTATMISFTLYELALNKEIQNRLRKEITESFELNGGFTYESVQDMKYLDMVFSESLRKYPLTNFLNREAATDYTFEETGLKISKGTQLLIPVAGLHFDPEYFPDPEEFIPERFSEKNDIKPYTYMPFGEGPRNCIGQRFAIIVSKLALACVVKNFEFEPTEETTIPLEFNQKSLFLRNKYGIRLKVVKV